DSACDIGDAGEFGSRPRNLPGPPSARTRGARGQRRGREQTGGARLCGGVAASRSYPRPMRRALALLVVVLLTVSAGCFSQPRGLSSEDLPEPFSTDAFNFLVVGDWGRNGFFNQSEVAQAMGRTGEAIGSRFVISTGDNFYTSGVTSVTDPKWARSFEEIYTAPNLQRPWYAVLGNHDWQGDVQAQI